MPSHSGPPRHRRARRSKHRGRRARRPRRRALLPIALALIVVGGGATAGVMYMGAWTRPRAEAVSPSPSSSVLRAADEEEAVESATNAAVDRDALLATAMKSVAVADGTEVSVVVLDQDSGESASYGTGAFDTASIVKVDILAALLLQAQDAGRTLTAEEKTYAADMIVNSDNDSTSALWRVIGTADGLDAANERFGLTETVGGDGPVWGVTQTTAADQIALLRQVFDTEGSELSEASRAYVRELMERIAVGQRWGVSAAADGAAWALKNGWLRRSATGLWVVNSIGRVTAGGHDYLVAALSQGNATQERGIALTEAMARAAVSVFTGDGAGGAAGGQTSS
ncbi:serine hydrolase [Streptomyces sp. NPDC018964]|uniref:serine hydrolase n=1 Tax=Streptomyces sp. NPDC018964 TaxID=3365058 RepID=UPI003796F390